MPIVTAISLAVAIRASVAWSAVGALDPTFGTGGIVTTDIAGQHGGDGISALALQPDGKIVAAGSAVFTTPTINTRFAVVRYLSNGARDPSFGSGGTVTTDLAGDFDAPSGVAVQSDGKIVVVGFHLPIPGGPGDIAIVRYNGDGSLDTTFGSGGSIISNPLMNQARAVALTPAGQILVAGTLKVCCGFAVARYTTAGTLDATFGTSGIARTDLGQFNEAFALAQQPDGRIVLGGFQGASPANFDFALVRFTANGSIDPTFGAGGSTTVDLGGVDDEIRSIALVPGGGIVAAGYTGASPATSGSQRWAIARFTPDGVLDATFGTGGHAALFGGSHNVASAVVVSSGGKLVVAGTTNGLALDFAIARLTPNGALDPTFGTAGVTTTDIGLGLHDLASALVQQPDGALVVGGSGPGESDFALVRYLGDPMLADELRCYAAKDLKHPPFTKSAAQLADDIVDEVVTLTKPAFVCGPVSENGSIVKDPAAHLCCYGTTGRKLKPPVATHVDDGADQLDLALKAGTLLCRPCSSTPL